MNIKSAVIVTAAIGLGGIIAGCSAPQTPPAQTAPTSPAATSVASPGTPVPTSPATSLVSPVTTAPIPQSSVPESLKPNNGDTPAQTDKKYSGYLASQGVPIDPTLVPLAHNTCMKMDNGATGRSAALYVALQEAGMPNSQLQAIVVGAVAYYCAQHRNLFPTN